MDKETKSLNREASLSARLIFHIGYHKTATTWLQTVFIPDSGNNFRPLGGRFEPRRDIVWPRTWEYQAEAIQQKYLPDLQATAAAGDVPVISDERFSGNPMSGGFDSKEIADRLKMTFPDSRIIIVIREQRSMLYSTYDEYVREGGGSNIHDFLFPKSRYCMPPFRFEHFMYDRLIRHYMSAFGPANVLVLPYELLRQDRDAFITRLVTFSGVTVTSMPQESRSVNESRLAAVLPLERRLNYFMRRDDLNGHSPLAIAKADYYIKPLLARLVSWLPASVGHRVKASITEEIKAACQGRFALSNSETAALTGLDLKRFGYDT